MFRPGVQRVVRARAAPQGAAERPAHLRRKRGHGAGRAYPVGHENSVPCCELGFRQEGIGGSAPNLARRDTPGETWCLLVYATFQNEVADSEVGALFTDVNGVHWRKNLIGQLDEIRPPQSPPAS